MSFFGDIYAQKGYMEMLKKFCLKTLGERPRQIYIYYIVVYNVAIWQILLQAQEKTNHILYIYL